MRRIRALAIAASLMLSACGTDSPPSGTSGTGAAEPTSFGTNVTIGIAIDEPGWGLLEGHSRSGFDYDLANWLANELDFKATFVDLATNQREALLRNGQVQMVIAAFSKTDKRAERMTFAAPYTLTQQGVLVKAGNTSIRTVGDLNGKTVCSDSGSTSIEQLRSLDVNIREEVGLQQCVDALLTGQVDATSSDQLILFGYANRNRGRVQVIPDLVFGHQERYGIALPLGQIGRCTTVLDAIHRLVASGKWDDFFANNMPGVPPATHKPDPNLLDPCE